MNNIKYILKEKDNSIALFVQSIHKNKSVNEVSTKKTIKSIFISWIKNQIANSNSENFVEYLISELDRIVDVYEVWMPIYNLHIENSFSVGKIHFRPITKEFIDKLILPRKILGNKVDEYEINLRKELQGFTASVLTIKSEPDRAHELLLKMTQESLSILRIFSLAAMNPKYTCNFYIKGCEKKQSATWITLKQGEIHGMTKSFLSQHQSTAEFLDQDKLNQYLRCGLAIINNILIKDKKTSFEAKVIDSLIIYSRCTTTDDLSDKLIYILASFESIFLKDSSEPIQQNLGERMAFLIGNTAEERKNIIKNLKTVYGLRSRFVHHGTSISDYQSLGNFMFNTWVAITQIIGQTISKQTKQEFIEYLDDQKLS
jgi:hypothetical protein